MIDEDDFREAFGTDLGKIEKFKADFIKFEAIESFESFKIMELFVGQLSDKKFKVVLENVLANKKSFQNFKNLIDDSYYRQAWFDFKQKEIERKLKNELEQGKPTPNK